MKDKLVKSCFTDSGMEKELTTSEDLTKYLKFVNLMAINWGERNKPEIFSYKVIDKTGEIPTHMNSGGEEDMDSDGFYSNARKYLEDNLI